MPKFNINPNMVFPSTKMMSVNKLITEGNLTSLINHLIDVDSYVIAPFNADFTDIKIIDGQSYLHVNSTDDLSFIIKGYYFDLGKISDILKDQTLGKVLTALIRIDITNPKYPELAGQTDFVKTNKFTDIPYANLNISLNANQEIKNIKFSDYNKTAGDYNYITGKITPRETLVDYTTYKVSYDIVTYQYSNIIDLYFDYQESEGSDDNPMTREYKLDILRIDNGEYYIPLESFHKLDSASIQDIDGGTIE